MQGLVTRSIPVRRLTLLDAMILTGGFTVGCWAGVRTLLSQGEVPKIRSSLVRRSVLVIRAIAILAPITTARFKGT